MIFKTTIKLDLKLRTLTRMNLKIFGHIHLTDDLILWCLPEFLFPLSLPIKLISLLSTEKVKRSCAMTS